MSRVCSLETTLIPRELPTDVLRRDPAVCFIALIIPARSLFVYRDLHFTWVKSLAYTAVIPLSSEFPVPLILVNRREINRRKRRTVSMIPGGQIKIDARTQAMAHVVWSIRDSAFDAQRMLVRRPILSILCRSARDCPIEITQNDYPIEFSPQNY